MLLLAPASRAITLAGLRNFSAEGGQAFVDQNGVLLPMEEARLQVGTFTPEFASTLWGLDAGDDLFEVLGAFNALGPPAGFVFDGLVNDSVDFESFSGQEDIPLYFLVTHTPAGGEQTALVLNFGTNFPKPDELGNAVVDYGPTIESGNILFGGRLVEGIDNSSLPDRLSGPEYSRGIMMGVNIDPVTLVPEPSSLALLFSSCLLIVFRRR